MITTILRGYFSRRVVRCKKQFSQPVIEVSMSIVARYVAGRSECLFGQGKLYNDGLMGFMLGVVKYILLLSDVISQVTQN